MVKIENDKYYTPLTLAKKCIETVYTVLGSESVSHVLEPSAGNGSFSTQIPNCLAYDIEPEHESILKQDFLTLDLEYLKGRLVIGNPPFGSKMNLAQKFYKKSVLLADHVAFILPISQLNNSSSLYEFDLVHSEDLGKQWYSDRYIHCCFNIYTRPKNGQLNKRKLSKLKDITIIRQDSKKFKDSVADIRMCYWGDSSAGKILTDNETYSAEYKIIIHNKELKQEIVNALHQADWKQELNTVAMLKIQQFHIVDYLKKQVPNIK